MLTSEIRTELASTHMNVDNVCELTSTRLRTDQRYLRTDRRRLRNDRWRNDSLAKRPTFFWLILILLVVHTLYNMELHWLFRNVPSRLLKYLSSKGKIERTLNTKSKYYKLETQLRTTP